MMSLSWWITFTLGLVAVAISVWQFLRLPAANKTTANPFLREYLDYVTLRLDAALSETNLEEIQLMAEGMRLAFFDGKPINGLLTDEAFFAQFDASVPYFAPCNIVQRDSSCQPVSNPWCKSCCDWRETKCSVKGRWWVNTRLSSPYGHSVTHWDPETFFADIFDNTKTCPDCHAMSLVESSETSPILDLEEFKHLTTTVYHKECNRCGAFIADKESIDKSRAATKRVVSDLTDGQREIIDQHLLQNQTKVNLEKDND